METGALTEEQKMIELRRQYCREYHAANRDRIRARKRKHYAENKERIQAARRENRINCPVCDIEMRFDSYPEHCTTRKHRTKQGQID